MVPVNQKLEMEDVARQIFEYREGIISLRDELNKDYLKYRTDNVRERRELFKYIATISVAVLGATSFVLEKTNNANYIIVSLVLHAVIILMTVVYFREVIDMEGKELRSQQNRYNAAIKEALNITDSFIRKNDFSMEKTSEFWSKIKESKGAADMEEENKKIEESRKNEEKNLDYFGELIIFLLISATLFMILGSSDFNLNYYELISFIVLILILSFSNFALKFNHLISKFATFLRDSIHLNN